MTRINDSYTRLARSYLFVEIASRVRAFQERHPERELIKLGIGDVTRPLPPACIEALHAAADEMADTTTFRGYGPEQGYDFLREAIVAHDYAPRSVAITPDDVFVSDGSKCDTGNFQELFATDQRVAVPDPVYPVYVDTNVMAGRTGGFHDGHYDGITYMTANRDNGFVAPPPSQPADIVYLCFPNNPTGATATRDQLATYVEWALEHQSLLLFDAAYAEFIRDESLPRSIFEIPGAERCAVEFRSFSKTAGFTGMRCAYVVIPPTVEVSDSTGTRHRLRDLWMRRHTTKFNGASFPVQRAAAAAFGPEGSTQIRELTDFYLENARIIRAGLDRLGLDHVGGVNSPYVWVAAGGSSWEFFDTLLEQAGVVTTPGAGFGPAGEGYIRISSFNERARVEEAVERIVNALGSS